MSTIAIALVAYQNYQMQLPKIEGQIILFYKTLTSIQDHLSNKDKEYFSNIHPHTDFFLTICVNNIGQRAMTLKNLENEQGEILYSIISHAKRDVDQNIFGCVLEGWKCYQKTIPLKKGNNPSITSFVSLETFEKSKRFYIVDTSNRKYLLPADKELRKARSFLHDYLYGIDVLSHVK